MRQTPPYYSQGEFWKNIDVRKTDFGWPSYSPDLNPADFFLWGFLKERVYLDPVPKTIEQLKNNIRRESKKFKIDMVKRAIDNMIPRVQNLLCRKGAWFENC